MNEPFAGAAEKPIPEIWYGIPHGYVQVDLDPPVEQIEELVQQVLALPDGLRAQAEPVVQFYAGFVTALNKQNARACLLGMHLDEYDEPATSVITFSTVPAHGTSAKAIIAGTAADTVDGSAHPLELPAGLAYFSEEERRTPAPGRPAEGSDGPLMGDIWQGTVAVTGSGGSEIVVIQLVTSAVEMAEDFRNILLGVAHTLSFSDPSLSGDEAGTGAREPEPDSVVAAVRSVFG
ncbi:hypothetical protein OG301_34550 [Streptomyces platensis]|uniref:hypothetical protein n=1 Tax=Streptomyces platensis TaxID=58346 RepID=UPI002E154F6B|nr:hypothetical protein OG229_04515 [Streptomyces platensis]WTI56056.1 hypothetical protein OG301_34550 [Streptomyces platensis]